MYQNLISNAPTPIVLAAVKDKPSDGVLNTSVGYSILGSNSGVAFVDGVRFSHDAMKGYFVRSSNRGYSVFGAKYSLSPSVLGFVSAFWCVFRGSNSLSGIGTAAWSSCTIYPFESFGLNSGSDTLTVDTSPVNSNESVYVGVVFLTSTADASFVGSLSVSQYIDQPPFFQPLK